jgi:hypothetical protein
MSFISTRRVVDGIAQGELMDSSAFRGTGLGIQVIARAFAHALDIDFRVRRAQAN